MEGHWLVARDDTIIPAICYASCNKAYLEAQRVGKSPELCTSDSAFNDYYLGCIKCIESKAADVNTTRKVYLDPTFSQFVDYCSVALPSPQQDVITLPATFFIIRTTTEWATFTGTDGMVTARATTTAVVTDLNPNAWTIGKNPSISSTVTDTSNTTSSGLGLTSTHLTSSVPTSDGGRFSFSDDTENHRLATPWIILASILSVVVTIALLGCTAFWLRRRRRSRHRITTPTEQSGYDASKKIAMGWERSQLHGDCLPGPDPQELDAAAAAALEPEPEPPSSPKELDAITKLFRAPYPPRELDATGSDYGELEAGGDSPSSRRRPPSPNADAKKSQ
ncbi:hypothetical protein QBC43DRAFT_327868 [Cladorrhinum sp. PSN259]|nr:hypothetical protein QBC43DRAFT_327868 [Cladorrhinum sp. PSN259]